MGTAGQKDLPIEGDVRRQRSVATFVIVAGNDAEGGKIGERSAGHAKMLIESSFEIAGSSRDREVGSEKEAGQDTLGDRVRQRESYEEFGRSPVRSGRQSCLWRDGSTPRGNS
jgi:hypothetical protein